MRARLFALVSLLAFFAPDHAFADPPGWTSRAAAGVRLVGLARSSSTDVPREPEYVLSNLTDAPRVVDVVALWSLGNEGLRERLSVTSARRITLAPHARRTLAIEYAGRAINLGGGLTYHRFELVVAVGGERLAAIASTAYICRIPLRRPTGP